MDALYLLHLQLELECIGLDENGLLVRIPGETPDDIACFFMAHHASGYSTYCRYDLEPQVIERLRALPPEQACEDVETVKRILYGRDSGKANMWRGSSYYFATAPSPAASPDVLKQGNAFVVLRAGDVVAQAWSARSIPSLTHAPNQSVAPLAAAMASLANKWPCRYCRV